MRFSNYSIRAKLLAGAASMLTLTLILSLSTLNSFRNFKGLFDKMTDQTVQKIVLAERMDNAQSDMISAQRLMLIGAAMKNTQEIDKGSKSFREDFEVARKSIDQIRPFIVTAAGQALVTEISNAFLEWRKVGEEMEVLARAGKVEELNQMRIAKATPLLEVIEVAANKLTEQQLAMLEEAQQEVEAHYKHDIWTAVALLSLSVLLGLGVVWTVRQITRSLHITIQELAAGSEQLAAVATQVSSASQTLAQSASEQAASLEETSASTEQVRAMARQNSDNTHTAAGLVSSSQHKFEDANQALESTVKTMNEIEAQSGNISRIIKVIDEIAFQTNILALNAAVEAARAGASGMGFAVVADEVRNLAQRCAQAAKDTTSLIEQSICKSSEGQARVDEVAAVIHEITQQAQQVQQAILSIQEGSQEQSRGMDQIGKAISQMEQVTQSTAAQSEESAATAEELTSQSVSLHHLVEELTTLFEGDSRIPKPPPDFQKKAKKSHHFQHA